MSPSSSSRARDRLRASILVGVIAGLTSIAGAALAHKGITGKSGKQGSFCTSCHQGGPVPTVKLDGPTSLDAGMSAVYTFTITTTNVTTAMNAAVSEGQLTTGDGGTTRTSEFMDQGETTDEIIQETLLKPSDAGPDAAPKAVYSFVLTAPQYGEKLTLYAAGNAVNGDDTSDGDNAAKDSIDIQVFGPPKPPPTAAPTATTPPPAAPTATATHDAGPAGPPVILPAKPTEDDSGCSIGWHTGPTVPAGAMFGALLALAALARRRR